MADVETLGCATMMLFGLLVRYATSLHPYSGHGAPPMYGDYEAHRHWMELTASLPLSEWYVGSARNDLLYWGIDYPPLSAYLSWLLGRLAARTHPELVALGASRGHESASTKLFMRLSVVGVDALVFLPAALLLARARGGPPRARALALGGLLLQPALILVDHGHFQYNCASLGLALGAHALALRGTPAGGEGPPPLARGLLPAAVLFCLALNFKQMSLYYAPAYFCHMLGLCLRRRTARARAAAVAALGATVGRCTAAAAAAANPPTWLPASAVSSQPPASPALPTLPDPARSFAPAPSAGCPSCASARPRRSPCSGASSPCSATSSRTRWPTSGAPSPSCRPSSCARPPRPAARSASASARSCARSRCPPRQCSAGRAAAPSSSGS